VKTAVRYAMSLRKTGVFHHPEEVIVLTCDVCKRDIGNEDGRRRRDHFRVSRHPNPGALNDQEPTAIIRSCNCLRAYAPTMVGPSRVPVG
jgi:hypothetical protein